MRIIDDGQTRRPEDLTARARIRDVAVERFATVGYRATTIRDVARAAGVSPGLVQHHFGSKSRLREACDAHVIELLRELTARKLGAASHDRASIASLFEAGRPVQSYIARGLTDGWPGIAAVFDQAAGDTEAWLTGLWPERFPAASREARLHAGVLVSMSLGTLLLHTHLARWAGVDPLARGQQHLSSAAMVELFERMAEYFATDKGRMMKAALADYQRTMSGAGGAGEKDRDE